MPSPVSTQPSTADAIERELGEGGMATVYLAEDIKHDRKVALKVLKPELAAVVGAERFLAEIKTTAKLQHPHILPLHDSGEADSFLFYVMPFVEGETLRDRIDREKQLPVDEAVRIASTVASARCTLTRSFTGWSMAGLRLERSGPRRDLHPSLPGRGLGPMACIHGWRS